MNHTAKIARGLALILALLLVATAAPAQLAKPDPHPGGIAWSTAGEYAGLELVVSGPDGFYLREEFGPGETPSIDLASGLPDGEYTWELVAMPSLSSALAEEMAAAANDPALRDDLSFDLPKRRTTSGFFRVLGGAIVQPTAEPAVRGGAGGDEGPTRAGDKQVVGVSEADQVILDDLIVDGSICAGQDCVNGESFGFDTLRLKENNLRIKAQDTSNSASFPSNDWQITFNESNNGGANKFSIDDIDGGRTPFTIEAGAPSHSLYVDDGGRIGLGTSTPVVEVHIKDGDTPTLRLEQDGSSGFTAQTWDVAGNEANFFVRDATNGSRLPFKIFPNAPDNSLTIEGSTGDIGIGTTSPDAALHVLGDGSTTPLDIENAGASFSFFRLTAPTASPNTAADMTFTDGDTAGTNTGSFRVNIIDGDPFELELDAAGNLMIDGTLTVTGGTTLPDYVFEPDYRLMPLDELAEFIQSEKHLPNVPSDAEVKARGSLNMSQMQLALLEKVEELTLYTLQQQEELTARAEESAQLRAEIAELTALVQSLTNN